MMEVESTLTAAAFELVQVTAKSATSGAGNLTVVRSQEGTVADAGGVASGTYLKGSVTAGMLSRLATGVLGMSPPLIALPQGTLQRRYTFDSSTQSWTASGGTLSQAGGLLQHVTAAQNVNYTMLEPNTAASVANGEYYIDLVSVSGETTVNSGMGVVFRATDANNHYLLLTRHGQPTGGEVASANAWVELYKKVSGTYTSLGGAPVMSSSTQDMEASRYPANGTLQSRIMVRFVGSLIQAFLDERHIGVWNDTTFTTGLVGFQTYTGGTANITTQWDNPTVYSLPSTWTPSNYDSPSISGLPVWQTPTFNSGWSNLGSGYETAGWYLGPDGIVHLRGMLATASGGTIATGPFTIPTGYRPEASCRFPISVYVSGSFSTYATVVITSVGGVTIDSQVPGTSQNYSLSGISYRQYG